MEKERPMDLEILEQVKDSSIIIVAGSYDRVENVLDMIKVPYVLIQTDEVDQIELKSDQILIVNCPGNISDEGLLKIKQFVKQGGFLFTTDWALLNILEKIFLDSFGIYKRHAADEFRNNMIKEKGMPSLDPLLYTYVDDDG